MASGWSNEFPLDRGGIRNAPLKSGVYEILQDREYPRYKLLTRTVKIGMSKQNLRQEIENHLQRHTTANRIKRIKNEVRVTYRYKISSPDEAQTIEKVLLKEFEDRHWDLRVCNSTRGYGRNEDGHYA